jgi:hypothetical protein
MIVLKRITAAFLVLCFSAFAALCGCHDPALGSGGESFYLSRCVYHRDVAAGILFLIVPVLGAFLAFFRVISRPG